MKYKIFSADTIRDFNHLEGEKFCLNGFELKKKAYILIYRIVFDPEIHFLSIKEFALIKIFTFSSSVMETLYHYHSGWYMEIMLNLQDSAC